MEPGMCEMGGGGVSIIIVAPKGMKPGGEMGMEGPHMDIGGPPPMDMGPEMPEPEMSMAEDKEVAPAKKPFGGPRSMNAKREVTRPRGLK